MDISKERHRFRLDGDAYLAELNTARLDFIFSVYRNGELIAQSIDAQPRAAEMFKVRQLEIDTASGPVLVLLGHTGAFTTACEVQRHGQVIHRSSKKPFKVSAAMVRFIEWSEASAADKKEKTPSQIEREENMQRLRPAMAVDIAMAILFFLVAREFGLVTAAVTGAAATGLLVIIDRFVKPDLTGGFAVFGACMALISAGLAVALQDDLFVKLRGSIMGLIGVSVFTIDGLLGGKYIGKRMALYMSGLFRLVPKRASFAAALGAFLIVVTDLSLVFTLTTDQWIWYDAFLDGLVAAPVLIGSMWFIAREKRPGYEAARATPEQG